jgi:hypothetical protein
MGIMSNHNVTIRDPKKRRGIHTQYSGDDTSGVHDSGHARVLRKTEFVRGKASVDATTRQMLKDRGVI